MIEYASIRAVTIISYLSIVGFEKLSVQIEYTYKYIEKVLRARRHARDTPRYRDAPRQKHSSLETLCTKNIPR